MRERQCAGVTSYPLKGCARLNEFSHFGSLFENRLDFILVSSCLLALLKLLLFIRLPPFSPHVFPLPFLYFPFRFSSSCTGFQFFLSLQPCALSSFLSYTLPFFSPSFVPLFYLLFLYLPPLSFLILFFFFFPTSVVNVLPGTTFLPSILHLFLHSYLPFTQSFCLLFPNSFLSLFLFFPITSFKF